jgi:hypothetical protein
MNICPVGLSHIFQPPSPPTPLPDPLPLNLAFQEGRSWSADTVYTGYQEKTLVRPKTKTVSFVLIDVWCMYSIYSKQGFWKFHNTANIY